MDSVRHVVEINKKIWQAETGKGANKRMKQLDPFQYSPECRT
jgi:SUMO ligase MMS21 Smc5/6 complex component